MWIYRSLTGTTATPQPPPRDDLNTMRVHRVQKITTRDEFTTAIQNQQELTIITFHSSTHASNREVLQKLNEITQHYITNIYTIDTATAPGLEIFHAATPAPPTSKKPATSAQSREETSSTQKTKKKQGERITPTFMLFRDEMLLLTVMGEDWQALDRGVGRFA